MMYDGQLGMIRAVMEVPEYKESLMASSIGMGRDKHFLNSLLNDFTATVLIVLAYS